MCRTVDLRIPGRSIVERRERRMVEKQEISKYHSQRLRISVWDLAMRSSRMRHCGVGMMSEKRSGAKETQNVNCLLAVLWRALLSL